MWNKNILPSFAAVSEIEVCDDITVLFSGDSFLADNFEEVCREFAALEGKDKIAVYVKLLEFGLPKRSHAEIMADGQLRLQTEQITGMVIK